MATGKTTPQYESARGSVKSSNISNQRKREKENMKKLIGFLAVSFAAVAAYALPTVSDVVAQQRWPWNGLVDIDYTITGDSEWSTDLAVRVTDHDTGKVYSPTNWHKLPPVLAGRHRATWDTTTDGLDVISTNMTVSMTLFNCSDLYMVIDLSGGTNTVSFPVSYLSAVPEGGWTDEYKTTKLVLRRIPAGTFIMGGNQANESRRVRITRPFYIGIFEVSSMQWALVRGEETASCDASPKGIFDSFGAIRGFTNPLSSVVRTDSFVGKLRAKTGMVNFELPTEAQWEYACRAGTTGDCFFDGNGRYEEHMWAPQNAGGKLQEVGMLKPNGWGLYDMLGNASEVVLDWWVDDSTRITANYYGDDPVWLGMWSSSWHIIRGGSVYGKYADCIAHGRQTNGNGGGGYRGFRICCSEIFASVATHDCSSERTAELP